MTSLDNVSLKFQTYCLKYTNIFCWKNVRSFCTAKASLIFFNKKYWCIRYKVILLFKSWPLSEPIMLTMLWTSGPRCSNGCMDRPKDIQSTLVISNTDISKLPFTKKKIVWKRFLFLCTFQLLLYQTTLKLRWLKHWWLVYHCYFELVHEFLEYFSITADINIYLG